MSGSKQQSFNYFHYHYHSLIWFDKQRLSGAWCDCGKVRKTNTRIEGSLVITTQNMVDDAIARAKEVMKCIPGVKCIQDNISMSRPPPCRLQHVLQQAIHHLLLQLQVKDQVFHTFSLYTQNLTLNELSSTHFQSPRGKKEKTDGGR